MGMPVAATVTGTTSFIFYPDWTISPFQVGIACVTSGAVGTFTIDVTFDRIDIGGGGGSGAVGIGLGTSAANATWWNIVAIGSANATANYTTPVQALRVNMVTAVATSTVVATFVQAGLPR